MQTWMEYESPIGSLLLFATDDALTELWLPDTRLPGMPPRFFGARDAAKAKALQGVNGVLSETKRQLDAYFAGSLRDFRLPLLPSGTSFQRQVWEQLCEIPYGTTISYGELARRLGDPKASRAVGSANGKNPIAIVIPCHRVIAADGGLGGYSGGLCNKEALLSLEGAKWITPATARRQEKFASLSLFPE